MYCLNYIDPYVFIARTSNFTDSTHLLPKKYASIILIRVDYVN